MSRPTHRDNGRLEAAWPRAASALALLLLILMLPAARLAAADLVNVAVAAAPLREALAALQEAAGGQLKVALPEQFAGRTVSVTIRDATPEQALRALLTAAKLTCVRRDDGVFVVQEPGGGLPTMLSPGPALGPTMSGAPAPTPASRAPGDGRQALCVRVRLITTPGETRLSLPLTGEGVHHDSSTNLTIVTAADRATIESLFPNRGPHRGLYLAIPQPAAGTTTLHLPETVLDLGPSFTMGGKVAPSPTANQEAGYTVDITRGTATPDGDKTARLFGVTIGRQTDERVVDGKPVGSVSSTSTALRVAPGAPALMIVGTRAHPGGPPSERDALQPDVGRVPVAVLLELLPLFGPGPEADARGAGPAPAASQLPAAGTHVGAYYSGGRFVSPAPGSTRSSLRRLP